MKIIQTDKPRVWQPVGKGVMFWRGCDSGGVLPVHSHEEFQLVSSESVAYEFDYRRSRTIVPPKALGVIQSGEPHASSSEDTTGKTLRLMFFAPDVFSNIYAESFESIGEIVLPNLVVSDRSLTESFQQMYAALETNLSALAAESLVFGFLAELVARCAESLPNQSQIRDENAMVKKAREYLEDNFSENVSLTELAQIVDRSPEHLVRVFTNEIGLPPHLYQTQVRISRAKALLLRGHAIADVALHVGFFDQAHFHRHFRRLNGITPAIFRQNIKNIQEPLF